MHLARSAPPSMETLEHKLSPPSSSFGSDRAARLSLARFAEKRTSRVFTVQSSSGSTESLPNHEFESRRNSDIVCILGRSEFVQVKMICC